MMAMMATVVDSGGGGDVNNSTTETDTNVKRKINSYLSPYEPLIMSFQSLLVWEYPWKSVVLFVFIHITFWFICTTSSRFFFLLSVLVMAAVFIDTWKNKIWPEIRVPPKEPEDKDGWTPVHPHLLSVPELSTHITQMYDTVVTTFQWLRSSRVTHPLVFCLGNTAFFTVTAMIGYYISGIMLAYLIIMSLMLWPCILYHDMLSKTYAKMEPGIARIANYLRAKGQSVLTFGGRLSISRSGTPANEGLVDETVDEDFLPKDDHETVVAALAKAISDSEDENEAKNPALETPRLSKAPSFSNGDGEEGHSENDFELNLNQMPSFDDLDNTDDELDLPITPETPHKGRLSSLHFASKHFGGSSPDSEQSPSPLEVDFPDSASTDVGRSTPPASTLAQSAGVQALTGALVARTISTMMESALQGMTSIGQGQTASSSSMIPRTGAKITYTYSEEGESVDFQNPEPTIAESEEDEDTSDIDSSSRMDQIAEIEKDFDFLDELDPDGQDENV